MAKVLRHTKFKPCPSNSPGLFVFIDTFGHIVDLETISPERLSRLRKWEESNGQSFPVFNIPRLLRFSHREDNEFFKKFQKESRKGVCNIISVDELVKCGQERAPNNWSKERFETIGICVLRKPNDLLKKVGPTPAQFKAVSELVLRSSRIDLKLFHEEMTSIVIKKIRESPNGSLHWMEKYLFAEYTEIGTNKEKQSEKTFSVALELHDHSNYEYPMNHDKVIHWINSRLFGSFDQQPMQKKPTRKDAFGDDFIDTEEVFPESKLPVLGVVILRAMSDDSKCQLRYNKAESSSFPLAAAARQHMKDAIEWLTEESRKGSTWKNISNATDYDKAILMAFPSSLPEVPVELANFISGDDEEDEKDDTANTARFEEIAQRVTASLEGLMKQNPNVTVNVLVLAKADKARTKIVLRSDFTATRLIESAQRWVEGGRNIPDIAYAQTKSPKLQLKPAIPHPAQVISLLKNVWPRDCSRSQKVKGVRIADGLGLLIERGAEERRTANLLLRFAIRHSFPLLSYIGHAQHRRDGKPKIDKNKVRQANSLFGLLGLLLFKLEYQKGDYMHGAPFLIGRLLALADTLHYEYCSHVREKSFPPQLIGNALIPAALDNPGSGLARLFERLRVYQAWAKTAQGENVGLAKWVIGQLGKTAEELSRLDLPGRCGDAAKAQMMLGYLAWMKYEKDDSDNAPKEGKQEEHHDA